MNPDEAVHRFGVRVYYEDTDLGGVVYYANYFRFIERARTEWLRDAGVDQGALKAETGVVFVVRRVAAEFLAPARMDDLLEVETVVDDLGRVKIGLRQRVLRGDAVLFEAEVLLACLGPGGRAVRVPDAVVAAFSA